MDTKDMNFKVITGGNVNHFSSDIWLVGDCRR